MQTALIVSAAARSKQSSNFVPIEALKWHSTDSSRLPARWSSPSLETLPCLPYSHYQPIVSVSAAVPLAAPLVSNNIPPSRALTGVSAL